MAYLVIDLDSLKPKQVAPLLCVMDGVGARVIGCLSGGDPSRDLSSVHCRAIIEKYNTHPEAIADIELPTDYKDYIRALEVRWTERREVISEAGGNVIVEDDLRSSIIPSGWVVHCLADAKKNWKRHIRITNELFGLQFALKHEHWIGGNHSIRGNAEYKEYYNNEMPNKDDLETILRDYRVLLAKAQPSWTDLSSILVNSIASLGPHYLAEMINVVEDALRRYAWEDPTNRLVRKIVSLKKEIAQLKGVPFVDEGAG